MTVADFKYLHAAENLGCSDAQSCARATEHLVTSGIAAAHQSANRLFATAPDIVANAKAVFGVSVLSWR